MKTALQIIGEMIHNTRGCTSSDKIRNNILIEAKERIKKETQWISVEDRLPEQFDDVLVYGDKWMCVDNLGNRHTYKNGFSRHMDVTHWMPLPLPPNE